MLCHIHYANGLSATTSNTIHGHAPYLTFNGGVTKGSLDELFGIRLSDGREYVPIGVVGSSLYPNAIEIRQGDTIELPNGGDSFNSIETVVPLLGNNSYPSIGLKDLIVNNKYWYDEDGDGNVEVIGQPSIKVLWHDANYNNITDTIKNNPTGKFSPCFAPYKLTLNLNNFIELATEYGEPRSEIIFPYISSYDYIFYSSMNVGEGLACYAVPPDRASVGSKYGKNWDSSYGFQVVNAQDIEENFPTTGTNGISFHLVLVGITPEQVINANGATVSAVSGGDSVTLLLSSEKSDNLPQDKVQLKITLKGPNFASSDKSFNPSLFKLYTDSSHRQLLYSFKIERWYIANPYDINNSLVDYAQASEFCRDLGNGYRVPSVGDYTNANGIGWTGGIPDHYDNYVVRQLSYKSGNKWVGGLINEWGDFSSYWNPAYYWTVDSYNDNNNKLQYIVGTYGTIRSISPNQNHAVVACVTP